MKKAYDFIWNITLICPWSCQFCCTDALHVSESKGKILIQENLLKKTTIINSVESIKLFDNANLSPNIFDFALVNRQKLGLELTYKDKIRILRNISTLNPILDFAGGDPLSCYENYLILQEASKILGKKSISITSTGHSIRRYGIQNISDIIGEYEFTYDENHKEINTTRPSGYNRSNLNIASTFSTYNVKTKAQLPIHIGNSDIKSIEKIYMNLSEKSIDTLLLMRTFPVGRGKSFLKNQYNYTISDYKRIIDFYKELEIKHSGTAIKLQCALKHTYKTDNKNPCDLMNNSFGINPVGDLLISAWATYNSRSSLGKDFILGNISKSKFSDIIRSEKSKKYLKLLDKNYGHCKIFAYMYSQEKIYTSLFSKADPLYLENK